MTREQEDLDFNAFKLQSVRWLLEKARLRYSLLGDPTGELAVSRIIGDVERERQRWLNAIDDRYA